MNTNTQTSSLDFFKTFYRVTNDDGRLNSLAVAQCAALDAYYTELSYNDNILTARRVSDGTIEELSPVRLLGLVSNAGAKIPAFESQFWKAGGVNNKFKPYNDTKSSEAISVPLTGHYLSAQTYYNNSILEITSFNELLAQLKPANKLNLQLIYDLLSLLELFDDGFFDIFKTLPQDVQASLGWRIVQSYTPLVEPAIIDLYNIMSRYPKEFKSLPKLTKERQDAIAVLREKEKGMQTAMSLLTTYLEELKASSDKSLTGCVRLDLDPEATQALQDLTNKDTGLYPLTSINVQPARMDGFVQVSPARYFLTLAIKD